MAEATQRVSGIRRPRGRHNELHFDPARALRGSNLHDPFLASARYLFFGDHGKHGLVPWIWTAIAFNVVGTILFFTPAALARSWIRIVACVLVVVGIWIEKGMGLIIPGFIPSTLHEVVEYAPSLTEWKITAGIWAFGLLLLTAMLKVTVMVFTNKLSGVTVSSESAAHVSFPIGKTEHAKYSSNSKES